jgi:uncharacterized protein YciI
MGLGDPVAAASPGHLGAEQRAHLLDGQYGDRLIACGSLLSDDGSAWLGSAVLAELPDRAAADELLRLSPCGRAGRYRAIEVHPWRFGGRPKA